MTTIIEPADVPQLRAMAADIGIEPRAVQIEGGLGGAAAADGDGILAMDGAEVDAAKKALEDVFNLY